jgi:hypothetical protein
MVRVPTLMFSRTKARFRTQIQKKLPSVPGAGQTGSYLEPLLIVSNWQASCIRRTLAGKTKMPTPKGEHFLSLFYQGDVRWENQFRRNRNRQKLCSWILFPYGSQVKEKSGRKFSVVTPS